VHLPEVKQQNLQFFYFGDHGLFAQSGGIKKVECTTKSMVGQTLEEEEAKSHAC